MRYIIIFFSVIIFIFIILRIFNRFWSTQPVFHFYNIFYWFFPTGLVNIKQPPVTKFYDKNIICDYAGKTTTEKKELLVLFLQNHYNKNNQNIYKFDKSFILEQLNLQKSFSHISLQYDLIKNKIISCLTTRLLCGYINKQKLFISFMDFLCVRDKYEKSNVGYNQIYTHYLKSRELNAAPIFLFKRNKKLKLLVPLTIYNSYLFESKYLNKINIYLPRNISCHIIKSYNFQIFKEFCKVLQDNFKCFIIPNFTSINNLIKKNILFPFIIKDNLKPIGIIVYKKTCISFKNKIVINCIASYCSGKYEEILQQSITNTVVLLKKQIKFDLINFENKSLNDILIRNLLTKYTPKGKLLSCYYFYNFISRPFKSKDVFLID